MLEVIISGEDDTPTERKRAFAEAAARIMQDELGTPPGRLRLLFRTVEREDTIEGLLPGDEEGGSDR